jgi:hypothetical protein
MARTGPLFNGDVELLEQVLRIVAVTEQLLDRQEKLFASGCNEV